MEVKHIRTENSELGGEELELLNLTAELITEIIIKETMENGWDNDFKYH